MKKSLLSAVAMMLVVTFLFTMLASCAQQAPTELRGEQGEQGEQGEPGANGTTGTNGKSAYELAQENGFEGSLSEWLASLVGEAGKDGINGKSAYELAQENGFEGSLSEWLDSLAGSSKEEDSGDKDSTPELVNNFNLTNNRVSEYLAKAGYTDSTSKTIVDDYGYLSINPSPYNYDSEYYNGYRLDRPFPAFVTWAKDDRAIYQAVTVYSDSTFTKQVRAVVVEADEDRCAIYNLIPNRTYYYKVNCVLDYGAEKVLKTGSFTTNGDSVRMCYVDSLDNVRDIGGWKTTDGKTVKYGLIYRGVELNGSSNVSCYDISDLGKAQMKKELGIREELDLRGGVQTTSPLGGDVIYTNVGGYAYLQLFEGEAGFSKENTYSNLAKALRAVITAMTADALYHPTPRPVYIHCQGGNDRTGTLITIILGLLGVSEADICKEYELSSFAKGGTWRQIGSPYYAFTEMIEKFKSLNPDKTLNENIYDYVTDENGVGLEPCEVELLRKALLE